MLVGNKIDLVERNNRKREVLYEEGKSFAMENQIMFSETSALSNLKVTESFEDLLQEIYNERRKVSRIQKKTNNGAIILNNPSNRNNNNSNCC